MRTEPRPEPVELSDPDLALVTALQADPRAPWAHVGAVTGTSAAAARRRWEALERAGSAWITTWPGPWSELLVGIVEVRCRPGTVDAVAGTLRRHPRIVTISGTTGDRDLVLTVVVDDLRELRGVLQEALPSVDGVTRVTSSVATTMFSDGSRWRAVGEPAEQRRGGIGAGGAGAGAGAGAGPGAGVGVVAGATTASGPDRGQWTTVLAELERDGRAPGRALAAALGTSDAHARRVLQRLLDTGRVRQRVDVATGHRRWPHALALWMVVPAARLAAAAAQIAALAPTRLCASLAGGASNLYVIVWLRDLSEAGSVEAELVRSLEVRVLDRALLLHYYKRVGHVFDADGRREGHVSWVGGG